VDPIRDLLSLPSVRRWLGASIMGRLASAMAPVAMLAIGDTALGSVAAGARLAAIVTMAVAVFGPIRGRQLDALGVTHGLRRAGWQSAVAVGVFGAMLQWRPDPAVLNTLSVVLGVALAPLPAEFRALLPDLVADHQLPAASNLDAVAFEVALIGSPAIVALLLWLASGSVLVVAAVAAAAAASAVLATGLPDRSGTTLVVEPAGLAWHDAGLVGKLGVALLLGLSGGLLQAGIFSDAERIGASATLAAGLLTVIGLGSALGGVIAAIRPPPASARTAGVLLAGYGAALLATTLSAHVWLLAAFLFAAGLPVAPVNSVGAVLLERRLPPSRRTTGFTIAASVLTLGTGLGQATASITVQAAGATTTLAGAALIPLIAGLTLIAIRSTR
jgi:hypothetical protein